MNANGYTAVCTRPDSRTVHATRGVTDAGIRAWPKGGFTADELPRRATRDQQMESQATKTGMLEGSCCSLIGIAKVDQAKVDLVWNIFFGSILRKLHELRHGLSPKGRYASQVICLTGTAGLQRNLVSTTVGLRSDVEMHIKCTLCA